MKEEKISVIIPVYKVEKYLDRCVESVINQSYKNLEIILVDDGSPDNCPKMCDEWAKKDSRIKVIHKKNGGVSSARNEGIKNATGKYLTFIDSDDYINENFSKFITKCLESNCEVCYSYMDGSSKRNEEKTFLNVSSKDIQYFIKNEYIISSCGRLFKREFIIKNELFFGNTLNAEDQEWSTRIYCKVKSVYVSSISFYCYIQSENSASKCFKFKNFESIYFNVKKIYKDAEDSLLDAKTKKLIKANSSKLLYYLIFRFGRFEGNNEEYFKLITSDKKLFIKPRGFKYFIIFLVIKVFGIKFTMKICKKLIK